MSIVPALRSLRAVSTLALVATLGHVSAAGSSDTTLVDAILLEMNGADSLIVQRGQEQLRASRFMSLHAGDVLTTAATSPDVSLRLITASGDTLVSEEELPFTIPDSTPGGRSLETLAKWLQTTFSHGVKDAAGWYCDKSPASEEEELHVRAPLLEHVQYVKANEQFELGWICGFPSYKLEIRAGETPVFAPKQRIAEQVFPLKEPCKVEVSEDQKFTLDEGAYKIYMRDKNAEWRVVGEVQAVDDVWKRAGVPAPNRDDNQIRELARHQSGQFKLEAYRIARLLQEYACENTYYALALARGETLPPDN
jgi:hypothetical protein